MITAIWLRKLRFFRGEKFTKLLSNYGTVFDQLPNRSFYRRM